MIGAFEIAFVVIGAGVVLGILLLGKSYEDDSDERCGAAHCEVCYPKK